MLEIKVRPANSEEKLNINVEMDFLPLGVKAFDSTDWEAHFFLGLNEGEWIVEINDPLQILKWTKEGQFIVQINNNGGGFINEYMLT